MALDTRDYWKKRFNKRDGYTENADFRIGVAEHKRKKYRSAWASNFRKLGLLVLLVIVLGLVKRWMQS